MVQKNELLVETNNSLKCWIVVLVVVEPLHEVWRSAAAYYHLVVGVWAQLKFEACAEVFRDVLDGIYRHDVATRYAEKEVWI